MKIKTIFCSVFLYLSFFSFGQEEAEQENKRKVEVMAKALLEYETIDSDQIADVMAGKKVRAPKPSAGSVKPPTDKKGPTIGPSDSVSAQPTAKN